MKRMLLGTALAVMAAVPAFAQDYTIIAPANPGGGWDATARTLQTVLQAEGIAPSVEVTNIPGAGGTVGLAQFTANYAGDPTKLLVGGYVMVGAILTNQSPVTLADTTPIARLTGEHVAIVVPAASEIQTVDELIAKLRENPGAVSWAGGSAGGVDHIVAGLLAKAADVDPTAINYIAYSGGGEALAAILGNQVTAGVSGIGEFLPQVQAGTMRLLAVTSAERIDGIDAPTLAEAGYDVVVQNWRSIAAAPGLTDEQTAGIIADFEALNASAGWAEALATQGWTNTFLAGDDFAAVIEQETAATEAILRDIGLVE